MRRLLVLALAAGGIGVGASLAYAAQSDPSDKAGFDCGNAANRMERLICSNPSLKRLDGDMSDTYAGLIRHAPPTTRASILRDQRVWLAQRDACADTACVTKAYDDRVTALWKQRDAVDRWRRRGVAKVGQCQATTIEQIGPRLGSGKRPDSSGTSVSFANGVHQVSYDLEPPIARSRLGDKAQVCLVSLPQNCPPGDDRGRSYAVKNLRTGERWRLFDSQHLCGGA